MRVRAITPILNVADVPASIRWFEKSSWHRGFAWNPAGATLAAGLVLVVSGSLHAGGSDPLQPWNDGCTAPLTLDFGEGTHLGFQEEPPTSGAEETPAPEPAAVGPFDKGTWALQTYGSAIFGDSGKGEMYLAHVGFGYYVNTGESLGLDFFGGYIRSGIDDDGGVGGVDLIYRIHFSRSQDEGRSLFLNLGAGLQQQSTSFSGDRKFNFRLLVGLGATFRVGEKTRLMLGANYLHISDAGFEGGGGGFDGPMLYGGITIPF